MGVGVGGIGEAGGGGVSDGMTGAGCLIACVGEVGSVGVCSGERIEIAVSPDLGVTPSAETKAVFIIVPCAPSLTMTVSVIL